jgi:hypothetical protein
MTTAEAVARVRAYQEDLGCDFLQALTEMEAFYDELGDLDQLAYRITMRVGQEMFAPVAV